LQGPNQKGWKLSRGIFFDKKGQSEGRKGAILPTKENKPSFVQNLGEGMTEKGEETPWRGLVALPRSAERKGVRMDLFEEKGGFNKK